MSQTLRLGIFIVFALLILSGAIFMATSNSFLFGSTYSLKAEFPTPQRGLGLMVDQES